MKITRTTQGLLKMINLDNMVLEIDWISLESGPIFTTIVLRDKFKKVETLILNNMVIKSMEFTHRSQANIEAEG